MCVGGFLVVVPHSAGERGWGVRDICIDCGVVTLFVLTSKSCDEGQVTSLIKGYLNLENELYERTSCYVLRAIIAVG